MVVGKSETGQYGNQFITKKFPSKTLFEMKDSSLKSLREVEYDNQNCIRCQKTPARPKNFQVMVTDYCHSAYNGP